MNPLRKTHDGRLTSRALAVRVAWVSIFQLTLAFAGVAGSCAIAQSVSLTPTVTATAIGCAPSGNGTGHMICVEYSKSPSLVGVSWEGPPALGSGPGTEPAGTIDTINPLGTAAGIPVGAPGCATTFDGDGTVACLVVSAGTGGFTLQGVALSPSTNIGSPLLSLGTQPATAVVSNPSCATASINKNGVIVCAVVSNNQVYGIAFAARKNIVQTPLTSLALADVTGSPSCVAAPTHTTLICAVRQGGGLLGFSFAYDAANNTVDAVKSVSLGAQTFSGDPSCALRADGAASCAIVSGSVLLGIDFNPATGAASGYQSLGSARDGTWTGAVACAPLNDFRNNSLAQVTPNPQNGNLVGCAALSSTGKLYHVSFDPKAARTLGIDGPLAANFSSSISCLELAIDVDQLYCGGISTNGAALSARLPVGLTPPGVQATVATLF